MKLLLNALLLLILSSCSSAPTKVIEEYEIPDWQIRQIEELKKGFRLNKEAVRLDARPFFLYKLSHIEGAHHIDPRDFFPKGSKKKLQMSDRHYFQARRLSRYGVDNSIEVVVFGAGTSGNGEEWLLALYLEYLGLENVEAVNLQSRGLPETTRVPVMPKAKPTWKPRFDNSLVVQKRNVESWRKKDDFNENTAIVLDVREEEAYLASSLTDLEGAKRINIFWKNFIDENSRPNFGLFESLVSVGFHPKKRILCVGDDVAHAATACMVLRRMGFPLAGIYL